MWRHANCIKLIESHGYHKAKWPTLLSRPGELAVEVVQQHRSEYIKILTENVHNAHKCMWASGRHPLSFLTAEKREKTPRKWWNADDKNGTLWLDTILVHVVRLYLPSKPTGCREKQENTTSVMHNHKHTHRFIRRPLKVRTEELQHNNASMFTSLLALPYTNRWPLTDRDHLYNCKMAKPSTSSMLGLLLQHGCCWSWSWHWEDTTTLLALVKPRAEVPGREHNSPGQTRSKKKRVKRGGSPT